MHAIGELVDMHHKKISLAASNSQLGVHSCMDGCHVTHATPGCDWLTSPHH